jgi:hypothetical protein
LETDISRVEFSAMPRRRNGLKYYLGRRRQNVHKWYDDRPSLISDPQQAPLDTVPERQIPIGVVKDEEHWQGMAKPAVQVLLIAVADTIGAVQSKI